MTATDPNANTFRPFRSVDPALGKLQANWTSSAPNRTLFQGSLAYWLAQSFGISFVVIPSMVLGILNNVKIP